MYEYCRYRGRVTSGVLDPPQRSLGKMIAMSLWGDSADVVWGAIANVVRAKVYLHVYTTVFYVTSPTLPSKVLVNHPRVRRALERLGAKFVVLSNEFSSEVPPQLWKYLSLDSSIPGTVLLRDVVGRITQHDKVINQYFTANLGSKLIFTVRENLSPSSVPLEDNRITFRGKTLGKRLEKYKISRTYTLIINYCRYARKKDPHISDELLVRGFLHHVLWPRVKDFSFCFDNTLAKSKNYCYRLPGNLQIKGELQDYLVIGRKYDAYDSLPKFLNDTNIDFDEESS